MEAAVEVTQEQINAVLGEDPAFEALIMDLMSPDNYQRGQAEGLFNACKEQRPDALTLKLVHVLKSRGNVGIREMAAVLLRVLFTGQINIWSRISETEVKRVLDVVKRDLLVCVEREEVKTVVKKLCDTVAELDALFKEDPWTDLRISMHNSVASITNLNAQVNLLPWLLMYAHLPRDTDLNAQVNMLTQYFRKCLSRGVSHDVGIAALRATVNCSFVRELLPDMMEMINHNEEVTAQMAFESFIELASTEPLVLLSSVDEIGSMLQIAKAPEWRRHLALEFIITLFEEIEQNVWIAEIRVRFFDKLFTILMEMLLDIEDDPDWHAPNTEDEDAGESSNYNVGRQCLYRLAISKGDTIIIPAFYLLRGYLADSDWRKRHAAFITLAKIAEGCADMVWNLEQVENMLLNSLGESHPRVRWAVINAICQLSEPVSNPRIAAIIGTTYFAYKRPAMMEILTAKSLSAAEASLGLDKEEEKELEEWISTKEWEESIYNREWQEQLERCRNPLAKAREQKMYEFLTGESSSAAELMVCKRVNWLATALMRRIDPSDRTLLSLMLYNSLRLNDMLFFILMEMLFDIEDWHATNIKDEHAGESRNYNVGRKCLYWVAITLEEYTIIRFVDLLPHYLCNPDWRKRHAGLIFLSEIAGSRRNRWIIREQGIREQVVSMVLDSFQHSHPRVQWAAINAISQLSKDRDSDLLYQQQVLRALAGAMDDSQNPKVQVSALKILSNMSKEGLPQDILKLYLVGIFDKLIHLLKNTNQNWMVRKAALAALEAFNDLSRQEGLTWCWMLTSFWTPPPPPPPKRDGYLFYA